MRRETRYSIVAYALLGAAALVSFRMPPSLLLADVNDGETPPQVVILQGVVRDFHESHVDFHVTSSTNHGHYTGSVCNELGADGNPFWTGGGRMIVEQALDTHSRNIAPNLANIELCGTVLPGLPGISVSDSVKVKDRAVVDGYTSSSGPYSDANKNENVLVTTNSTSKKKISIEKGGLLKGSAFSGPGSDPKVTIQVKSRGRVTGVTGTLLAPIAIPTAASIIVPVIGGSPTDLTYASSVDLTNTSIHAKKLTIKTGVTVSITGNVIIVCDEDVLIEGTGAIHVNADSLLTIYAKKKVTMKNTSSINMNSGLPARVQFYHLGGSKQHIDVESTSKLCATVVSPNGQLHLKEFSEFYGRFSGKKFSANNDAKAHIDDTGIPPLPMYDVNATYGIISDSGVVEICVDDDAEAEHDEPEECYLEDDTIGQAGVYSASTFYQWFKDVIGVNISTTSEIVLIRQSDGVYVFDDTTNPWYAMRGGFFPADAQLFGNEGDQHNYNFAFEMAATFTYRAGMNQFLELSTTGDAWVFIDGLLAIDLGGIHGFEDQFIDLQRLCLVDGQTYVMTLHLAQRSEPDSSLWIRTNILFDGLPVPSVNVLCD